MKSLPLSLVAGAISALLLCRSGAEILTTVIRPSVAYTVTSLSNGVYQDKQARLYSNGYSGQSSSLAAVARMEFQIPPAVLVGLKTMEFRARQIGYLPTDKGYSYLFYYDGNIGETTKTTPYARDAFSAKSVHSGDVFSRNLLEGFATNSFSSPLKQKFGLILTSWFYDRKEVTFEDPQIIITYEPAPVDNGAAVTHLLTADAAKPFQGLTDPAIIGFDADPDHDGLANFYELWRGTAPDKPSSPAKPTLGKTGGFPYVRVVVSKYADDRMLVGAQASHNLVDWRDISATRTSQVSSSTVTVTFTDVVQPAAGQACYFRFVGVPEGRKYE